MASIVIHVTGMGGHNGNGDLYVGGVCRTSDMVIEDPSVSFYATFAPTALAATINEAIKDAAITAAEAEGYGPVGLLDKKSVLGGAVGL